MKLFACQGCGNPVHFDNSTCLACGRVLGYLPAQAEMTALERDGGALRALGDTSRAYVFCANARYEACNWLLPADDGSANGGAAHCEACRHNRTVPQLSQETALNNWRRLEVAKRYLFYSLIRWRLPRPDRNEDPEEGLAFDFLEDTVGADDKREPVMTGHASGLITISLAEADDAEREKRLTQMHEPYRTLVGHFRHESGHYYWDRLVRDRNRLDACRALFGDDTMDYGAALQRHHDQGAPANWQARGFISTYATSHPWEDFAETWAHYLHMVDSLETAAQYGIAIRPRRRTAGELEAEVTLQPYFAGGVDELVAAWTPLTVAINSINRSMGQPDLYPFVLSDPVLAKLQFVHDCIHQSPAT